MGGRILIKQARIQAQIAQINEFFTAYNNFKDKYNAIPGDMRNATDYWDGTSNGDGNGRLTQSADHAYNTSQENLKFFHHISLAGYTKETYNGTWGRGVGYPTLRINPHQGMVAAGSIRAADLASSHQLTAADVTEEKIAALYLNVANHLYQATGVGSNFNDFNGIANPTDMQSMDRKMDDGIARTGAFRAHRILKSELGNCLTATGGDYLKSEQDLTCVAEYILEQ